MSYDRESSTLRKEPYNIIGQQVSNYGISNNDDIYLGTNDIMNPANYRQKLNGSVINSSIPNQPYGFYQHHQPQQQLNQSHFLVNYNSNIINGNYNDIMDQFQHFEEIKNDDDEEYLLNNQDTSSQDNNANSNEDNNNLDNNNNNINEVNSEKQYICDFDECRKVFKAKKSLRDHLRIHTNQRPYTCLEPNCGKSFVQYSSLQKHSRTHKGDRPYKCDYDECDQAFTQVSNLKRHQKIHSNDKPYECNQCLRKFTTSSNLKQHQITHENQRERQRFRCQIDECGKSYLYSSSLKKHEKEHILNSNPKGPLLAGVSGGVRQVNENCEMHGNKIQKHLKVSNNIHSDEILEEEDEEELMRQEREEQEEEEEEEFEGEEDEQDDQEAYNPKKYKSTTKKENSGDSKQNHISQYSESSNSQQQQFSQKLKKKKVTTQQLSENEQNFNAQQSKINPVQQNQQKANNEEMEMLGAFFNSHHIALQHDGHYDILFKGYLYHYNKKTGKIEIHDIQAQDEIKKGTCQPLSELTHNTFEDAQKKMNEIEYRYNGPEILNDACNPLSCKCGIDGTKGCCSSDQTAGNSSACCCAQNKTDKQDITQTNQPSGGGGGCCSSASNKQSEIQQQNLNLINPQNQKQNETITDLVCCNEPNCPIDNVIVVSGNQEKAVCCSIQSDESNIQINVENKQSCCSSTQQNQGQLNEQQKVRQDSQQNQGIVSSQVKAEDCCCTIDQVKIECTCIGCDEDCQSCSKSTKCIYKVQFNNNPKESSSINSSQIPDNNIIQIQINNKNKDDYQQIDTHQVNQQHQYHSHSEQQILANSKQYEIIEPKESYQNQAEKKQPKCICNDTKDLKHLHGPNCGHIPIYHHGHLDYIVENQLHHPHGTHCDFHGIVNILDNCVKI